MLTQIHTQDTQILYVRVNILRKEKGKRANKHVIKLMFNVLQLFPHEISFFSSALSPSSNFKVYEWRGNKGYFFQLTDTGYRIYTKTDYLYFLTNV